MAGIAQQIMGFRQPIDKLEVDKNLLLEKSKKLIEDLSTEEFEKQTFLRLLSARLSDLDLGLQTGTALERYRVMEKYKRFANSLHVCLSSPKNESLYAEYYFGNKYYPVGTFEIEKQDPLIIKVAEGGVALAIALILASIPAFVFNPVIGGILLAAAVSLLLPSIFTLMIPDSMNTEKKKAEETTLFECAAKLVQPLSNSNNVAYLPGNSPTLNNR